MRTLLLVLLPAAVIACDGGPPVKSASGERIEHLSIEESFPTSDEVKETTLRGDKLRTAIELMEKHGAFDLKGTFESKAGVANGTVTLAVKPVGASERRIVVKSCVHKNVCAFLGEAVEQKLLPRLPVACKSTATCDS